VSAVREDESRSRPQVFCDRHIAADALDLVHVRARDEDRATPRASRELHVARRVADHPASREVGGELPLRALEHPRFGLAAAAAGVGDVRAVIARSDVDALASEILGEVTLELLEVGGGEVAAADSRLVRDYRDPEAGVAQRAETFDDTVEQTVVGDAVHVAGIVHQRAVAIHEDELSPRHVPHRVAPRARGAVR